MLSTFTEAARVVSSPLANQEIASGTDHPRNDPYYQAATRNADFLLTALRPDGRLCRTWRDGHASGEVFLEDYAALINGLLDLYQTDFNPRWFATAQELADEMIARFTDPAGGFFDTPSDGESLLLRPKDIQDNATPSGSALATEALLKLASFTDRADYRALAEQSLRLVAEHALRYPTAFARWLGAADFALANVKQVAVIGDLDDPATRALIAEVHKSYRPNMIVAASAFPPPTGSPALLADRRPMNGKPTVYVCEGFVCKTPVATPEELRGLLL
jgi:uncharacterized protein YyaL (SSP411 family)